MAALCPAARVTIALFSAYILVLQLLLAGIAGGAVAGSVVAGITGSPICSSPPPLSADASALPGPKGGAGCIADCLLCDARHASAALKRPESHGAPTRWTGGAAAVRRAAERSLPPARAPPV